MVGGKRKEKKKNQNELGKKNCELPKKKVQGGKKKGKKKKVNS
jgi:hypothetical protein